MVWHLGNRASSINSLCLQVFSGSSSFLAWKGCGLMGLWPLIVWKKWVSPSYKNNILYILGIERVKKDIRDDKRDKRTAYCGCRQEECTCVYIPSLGTVVWRRLLFFIASFSFPVLFSPSSSFLPFLPFIFLFFLHYTLSFHQVVPKIFCFKNPWESWRGSEEFI